LDRRLVTIIPHQEAMHVISSSFCALWNAIIIEFQSAHNTKLLLTCLKTFSWIRIL